MTRDLFFDVMIERERLGNIKDAMKKKPVMVSLTSVLALVKKKMKLEGQDRCVEEAIAVHAYNEGIRDVYTALRAWGKGK